MLEAVCRLLLYFAASSHHCMYIHIQDMNYLAQFCNTTHKLAVNYQFANCTWCSTITLCTCSVIWVSLCVLLRTRTPPSCRFSYVLGVNFRFQKRNFIPNVVESGTRLTPGVCCTNIVCVQLPEILANVFLSSALPSSRNIEKAERPLKLFVISVFVYQVLPQSGNFAEDSKNYRV